MLWKCCINFLNSINIIHIIIIVFYPIYALADSNDIEFEPPMDYIVSVNLNDEFLKDYYKLIKLDNLIYIDTEFFEQQKVKRSYYSTFTIENNSYVLVNDLEGVKYYLNKEDMALKINLPITAFEEQLLRGVPIRQRIDESEELKSGAYINYGITDTRTDGSNNFSAFPELTYFNEYGTIRHESLFSATDNSQKYVRLRTYYQYDIPSNLTKLVIGDSYTTNNNSTASAIYGGIKYSTDFSIDPYFVTYPTINLKGLHQVPSTLDIYENNIKLYQAQMRGGQYQITDLPAISGRGNYELEVTDITGNKERIIIPYYLTPTLLKEGLSSYSYEAGFRRKNFGNMSNKYEKPLANFYYRYGLTDEITTGVYLQSYKSLKAGGAEVALKLSNYGIISGSSSFSKTHKKAGNQSSIGYEYLARNYSVGTKYTNYLDHFSDIGTYPKYYNRGPMMQIYTGYSDELLGNFNINYTKFKRKDNLSHLHVGYQRNLFSKIDLYTRLGRTFGCKHSTSFIVSLQLIFGDNNIAILSREKNGKYLSDNFEYISDKTKYLDGRLRLKVQQGEMDHYHAQYERQFKSLRFKVAKSRINDRDIDQINLQGGVIFAEGIHFTDSIQDTFAIIKVGDIPNVKVLANHNDIGFTDSNGVIVTSMLIPQNQNYVSIDEKSLPIDVDIGDTKKSVYPIRMKATKIVFEAEHNFIFKTIILDGHTGNVIPTGSMLKIKDNDKKFLVGFDGTVFINLNKFPKNLEGEICEENKCCQINIKTDESSPEVIKDLGVHECKYN